MRLFKAIAVTAILASFVQFDGISITPLRAADRVADVLAGARKALGGADKLAAVKAVSAEGPFRRSMGPRDMEGTISLLLTRDKFRRSEEMQMGGMVNGPSIERVTVFNGTEAWDDVTNNGMSGGPGGGGFRMEIRTDGPGPGGPGRGPGGPGGPGASPLTPEQIAEQRVRRMKVEMQRWTIALLADTTQPWVDAGVAESPDGKADMLDTKDENGRDVRLFIDQATHMPLMVQYQEIRPQMMIQGGPRGGPGRGGPGGPGGAPAGGTANTGGGAGDKAAAMAAGGGNAAGGIETKAAAMAGAQNAQGGAQMTPEQMQARLEEMRKNPPKPSTFAMHLTDYKKVDGIMLPHKIDIAIDGQPNEEWTIEKYKVNPTVKADVWVQPKK